MSIPRPAATLILLRDTGTEGAVEVLLLKRSPDASFAPSTWVFPGGSIDTTDFLEVDERAKEDRLQDAAKIAAARETQEECNLCIPADDFIVFSRWITPKEMPKRFDTWFMLSKYTGNSPVVVDDAEIVDYQWMCVKQAANAIKSGRLRALPPALISLIDLESVASATDAVKRFRDRLAPIYKPKMIKTDVGFTTLYEDDCGYETADANAEGLRHRTLVSRSGLEYINEIDN